MKFLISILCFMASLSIYAKDTKEVSAYINQNIGFNVQGYKYSQDEFPCDVDKVLVKEITKRGKEEGVKIEAVGTADKIRNGVIPVIAIDIEEMVLGNEKKRQYGTRSALGLPKMQVTAAVVKGNDIVTAKHTCAIASVNEFTTTSNVLDLGTPGITYCRAMEKCLRELSEDIVDWAKPNI